MKIAIFASFAAVLGASVFSQSQAQELKVGLLVEPAASKTVLQVAEEKITVQNNDDADLPVGVLEVSFPAEINLNSATPAVSAQTGQKVTWAVPAINSGASFTVRYALLPMTSGKNLLTAINYSVGGRVMTATQVTSDINLAGGEVKGETTLPRTGTDPRVYLLLLVPALILLSKRVPA